MRTDTKVTREENSSDTHDHLSNLEQRTSATRSGGQNHNHTQSHSSREALYHFHHTRFKRRSEQHTSPHHLRHQPQPATKKAPQSTVAPHHNRNHPPFINQIFPIPHKQKPWWCSGSITVVKFGHVSIPFISSVVPMNTGGRRFESCPWCLSFSFFLVLEIKDVGGLCRSSGFTFAVQSRVFVYFYIRLVMSL